MDAETCRIRACLFKCKWAAAPHPLFQNRAAPLQLVPAKNICFGSDIMLITLKSCVLNHISLNFWYMVFWVHTSEAHVQKAAVTWHVSTKLSSHSHTSLLYKMVFYIKHAVRFLLNGLLLSLSLHTTFNKRTNISVYYLTNVLFAN